MMNLFRLVVSVLLLGAVCGEQFKIPQVEAVVGEILVKADSYVHYTSNVSEVHDPSSVRRRPSAKRASTYWYENIAHQGISAFGPSGYTVYRNVMDYGATGNMTYRFLRWQDIILIQLEPFR
jgi:glucan 1,3-beta-glucosidase